MYWLNVSLECFEGFLVPFVFNSVFPNMVILRTFPSAVVCDCGGRIKIR